MLVLLRVRLVGVYKNANILVSFFCDAAPFVLLLAERGLLFLEGFFPLGDYS